MQRTSRDPRGGNRLKISQLRVQAHENPGVLADLLLSAFGPREYASEADETTALAASVLLVELLMELRVIRKGLTSGSA